jgi:hypothetical protein
MTPNSLNDRSAYNKYFDFPDYSFKCIEHLMDNNEEIWKLLKYTTPQAWEEPNLTSAEKRALIWKGHGISSDYRIFMDDGPPDVVTKETAQLRIYPFGISPDVRNIGTVTIMMETYSHYKINTLSNYRTRTDTIIQQLIETFNGLNMFGIGRMHLSKKGTSASRMESGGQLPFKGKWLLFGNDT